MLPRYTKLIPFENKNVPENKDFIMTISGYASTIDVDRVNEIVEPKAFLSSESFFKDFPVLHVNHDMRWSGLPIGKVTDYLIDERGLLIEAVIANTDKGQEVKKLIELDILRGFSIGFNIKNIEWGANGAPSKITDLELIEISVVSSPANTEAVIEQAQAKGITIKALSPEGIGKGVIIMSDLKKIEDSLANQGAKVKEVEVTVSEVQSKVDAHERLMKQIQETNSDKTKSEAEIRQTIDKVSADVIKSIGDIRSELQVLKSRKTFGVSGAMPIKNHKDALQRSDAELKNILGAVDAGHAIEFKRLNDELIMVDAILECSSRNADGKYHERSRKERIKTLRTYEEANEFRKALDTGTADEGLEWVPTDMGSNLQEFYRLNRKVAGLFEEFTMPAGAGSFDWPIQESDSTAKLIGETTAVQTAYADANEETPNTGKVTFTAKKARSRLQIAAELTEDAAFAITPWATKQAGIGIVNAVETGTINGDTTATHQDSDTTAGTDFRKAWEGLRETAFDKTSSSDLAGAALTKAHLHTGRATMGKYGVNPAELAWIWGIQTYLKTVIGGVSSEWGDLQTLDKIGPQAILLTGQVMNFAAVPVVVSEFIREDLNASGVHDGVTTTRSVMIIVHRPSFMYGTKRQVQISVEKLVPHDVFNVFAFKRQAFTTMWPATTEKCVHQIYDYVL